MTDGRRTLEVVFDECRQRFFTVLVDVAVRRDDVKDALVAASFCRLASHAHSIRHLREQGLALEASMICRSSFETVFWIAGLIRISGFESEVELDHNARRFKLGKDLRAMGISDPEVLKAIDAIAKPPSGSKIEISDLAKRAGVADLYIYFSFLSNNSAHVSASSLNRHVKLGGDGRVIDFSPELMVTDWSQVYHYKTVALCAAAALLFEWINRPEPDWIKKLQDESGELYDELP